MIFESIYNQGLTYITAGGNAMRLRRDLETGLRGVLDRLAGMTQPLRGRRALEHFAYSVCYDPELAHMLGEVFDIIGEYGRLDIRGGQGRSMEREYVEGMYWDAAPYSREMLTGQAQQRVDLEDAAILVSDLHIEHGQELVPLLEAAAQAGERRLLLICQSLAPQALGLLMANSQAGRLQIVAVHTPYVGTKQKAALEDLALLTGAQALLQAAGDSMAGATTRAPGPRPPRLGRQGLFRHRRRPRGSKAPAGATWPSCAPPWRPPRTSKCARSSASASAN